MSIVMTELLKLTNSEGDAVLVNKGSQAHDDYVAKGFADKKQKAESTPEPKPARKPRAKKAVKEDVSDE